MIWYNKKGCGYGRDDADTNEELSDDDCDVDNNDCYYKNHGIDNHTMYIHRVSTLLTYLFSGCLGEFTFLRPSV